MSMEDDFSTFVKAHWLADTDIDEFFTLDISYVNQALMIYQTLDFKIGGQTIDTHGRGFRFYEMSNKLDRSKHV